MIKAFFDKVINWLFGLGFSSSPSVSLITVAFVVKTIGEFEAIPDPETVAKRVILRKLISTLPVSTSGVTVKGTNNFFHDIKRSELDLYYKVDNLEEKDQLLQMVCRVVSTSGFSVLVVTYDTLTNCIHQATLMNNCWFSGCGPHDDPLMATLQLATYNQLEHSEDILRKAHNLLPPLKSKDITK